MFVVAVGKVGDAEVLGEGELVSDLHVSAAQNGRVNGQQDSLVSFRFRPLDQLDAVVPLFEQVELQRHRRRTNRILDIFQRLRREAAQSHDNVLFLACARCRDLAIGVREAVHCGTRGADGHAGFLAEDIDGGVDDGDVAEDAWADAVFLVRGDVFGERSAGVCAFVVVVACLLVHALCCEDAELFDGETVQVSSIVVRHGDGIKGRSAVIEGLERKKGTSSKGEGHEQQWLVAAAPSLYQVREIIVDDADSGVGGLAPACAVAEVE